MASTAAGTQPSGTPVESRFGTLIVPSTRATGLRRLLGRSGVRKDRAPIPLAIFAWIVALIVFFPIFQFVITGFKTEQEAVAIPPRLLPWPGYEETQVLPETINIEGSDAAAVAEDVDAGLDFRFAPTLEQYRTVFSLNFGSFFLNSLMTTLISTAVVLILGIPAAYALSILAGKRSSNTLFFLISTRFLPTAGVLVPLLLIYRQLELLNTIPGLIILYIAMNLPIAIWVMRSFFEEIPRDIIDAARLDGASLLREIFQIALPVVRPGIVATAFICMIFAWNEFFLAAFLAAVGSSTVPIFMLQYVTGEGLFWAKLSAAVTIGVLPIVLLGWIAQGQLVRGLSLGAVK
ncbi:MAG TPA: carbohydrate ABC transporter permease [Thermomicrobiales bacterium]|jgi:sorbitol/mannitol transport system permease protein|nr:carbohydrate ABC transporter permease [Thermomicrobiales bacterium]